MEEKKIIKVKGQEYEIIFPNVGQYYRIETLKQSLSKGYYNALLRSEMYTASNALDMIDIEATLTVICPKLIEDLKVKNFSELGLKDFQEIRKIYRTEVMPFLKEVYDLLKQS